MYFYENNALVEFFRESPNKLVLICLYDKNETRLAINRMSYKTSYIK